MQSIEMELQERGIQAIAISADTPEELVKLKARKQFTMPLLADPNCEVIKAFGLLHKGGNPFAGDISRPALILLSPEREVQFRLLTGNWRVRPTPDQILKRIGE